MYSIKVAVDSNGRQYATGMGIGVENTPSGMQSQVVFLADRFAVTHQAGATVTLPFVIQNGQTIVNDAVIGNGTISNAKIGNYIQSSTWDGTGNVGWHINKSGYAVFNNVTVRGTVYASSGSFSGTINATDGTFNGTVSARRFVGDIVAFYSFRDRTRSGQVQPVTYTYNDSSNFGLEKTVLFQMQIARTTSGTGSATAYIKINGNEKSAYVGSSGSGPALITHSIRTTSDTITITVREEYTGSYERQWRSPTIMIGRSSGNFSES